MNMISKLGLIGQFSVVLVLAACGSKSSSNNAAPAATAVPSPAPLTAVTFADITPALKQSCTTCHNDASTKLPHLGQQSVFDSMATTAVALINSTDPKTMMPPPAKVPPLTAAQKTTLLAALEPAAGATAPDFTKEVAPILAAECSACHSKDVTLESGKVLTAFAAKTATAATQAAFTAQAALIAGPVSAGTMPPVHTPLTDAQKSQIAAYVSQLPAAQ